MPNFSRVGRLLFAGTLLVALSACKRAEPVAVAPPAPSDLTTKVKMLSFLAQGIPEQDVYVAAVKGSSELHRFDALHTGVTLEKNTKIFLGPVFGSDVPHPHDIFGTKPLTTVQKGRPIGVVLQAWGNGRAVGTYAVKGGTAHLKVYVEGMMRGGTYSLWCGRFSKASSTEKPCADAIAPIVMDRKGEADLDLQFPAPLDSSTETGTWLLLAYHSDNHQKPIPHDFGKDTHVQLAFRIPSPAELKPAY